MQKAGFHGILLGMLGASLLRILLRSEAKWVMRVGEGVTPNWRRGLEKTIF